MVLRQNQVGPRLDTGNWRDLGQLLLPKHFGRERLQFRAAAARRPAASPAFRQVCDRNVSRSQSHSTGTCGSSSPRRLPCVTTRPCFPTTTSSGAIGCERRQHADLDLQRQALPSGGHRLETRIVEGGSSRRLGHGLVQRLRGKTYPMQPRSFPCRCSVVKAPRGSARCSRRRRQIEVTLVRAQLRSIGGPAHSSRRRSAGEYSGASERIARARMTQMAGTSLRFLRRLSTKERRRRRFTACLSILLPEGDEIIGGRDQATDPPSPKSNQARWDAPAG